MRKRPGFGALVLLAGAVALLVASFLGSDGGSGGDPVTGHVVTAKVERVIDGDTIEVSIDGLDEDVRYIGMDTPETVKPGTPVQCYGPEASAENHRLVEGQSVRLVFDAERRDDYGRLLAYVHARGRFVNAVLVRAGFARTLTFPPNTDHAGLFRRLQNRAAESGRGLWGSC